MNPSTEFLKLVGEARKAKGTVGRIRAVSRLWQFFSAISREERVRLLAELGLQQGDEMFEAFLSSPGSRAGDLLQRIEFLLEKLDPKRIEQIATEALGKTQADALLGALGILRDQAVRTAEPPPLPPLQRSDEKGVTGVKEPPSTTRISEPDVDSSPSVTSDSSREPAMDLNRVGDQREKKQASRTQTSSSAEPSKFGPPVPDVIPMPPSKPRAAPVSEPAAQARGETAAKTDREPPKRRTITAPIPAASQAEQDDRNPLAGLLGELSRIESPSHRFLYLSRRLEGLRRLRFEDVDRLLQTLPTGWMHRRILCQLLTRRTIRGSIKEVLPFITKFSASPFDYAWYCSALSDSGRLTKSDRELLLETAPTRLVRYQLRRRRGWIHVHRGA